MRDILGGSANLAEGSPASWKSCRRRSRKSCRVKLWGGGGRVYGGSDERGQVRGETDRGAEEAAGRVCRATHDETGDRAPQAIRSRAHADATRVYRDLAVRNFAADARNDKLMLKMIGASQQQIGDVQQISRSSTARAQIYYREMGLRLLKILTSAQEQKLRVEVEEEFARIDALTFGTKPAAEGGSPSLIKTGSGTLTVAGTKFDSGIAVTIGSATVITPATQPWPGTKFDSSYAITFGSGTVTSTPNLSLPQRLPPYNGIFFPELQKEMNLSAEQRKRLSEVSADFWSKFKEISKENSDMTDQQKCAKYAASIDQLARDCRKQIEAVVTPQQLDAYKKAVFPRLAFELLSLAQPESRKTIGVTSGQEEKLQQIFKELSQQPTPEEMKRMEQAKDAVLAALSPQQREKLRSDVEQEIRNDEESSLSYSIGTYSGMPIFNLAVEAGSRWAPMVLPFYSELTETAIAQRLGLIADQRKQLTEVAGQHRGETVKLAGEIKKLSPDQRKTPRVPAGKARRMLKAVRRRTEAVLTPQQLAAVKDTVFRRRAFSTLADPNVEVKMA